jgi:hypothetical protein
MAAADKVTEKAGPPQGKRVRRWGWKAKLATLFASLLGVLLVAKIGLRIAGIAYPGFIVADEVLGWSLRPGAAGWWRGESRADVAVNRWGMRGPDLPLAKPAGTFRIAVLGDSFTEAHDIAADRTFCAVLERELTARHAFGGKRVEVLNFGVIGYGTAQELLMLQHRAWQTDPDLVLLAFFSGNDIRDSSKALNPNNRPYFVFDGDQLVLDNSFREGTEYRDKTSLNARLLVRLLDLSRVAQLLNGARNVYHGRRWEAEAAAIAERVGGDVPELRRWLYRPPQHPLWAEAWTITERLLVIMRDETAQHHVPLAVVTLTLPERVHPDPEARRKDLEELEGEDLDYPDRRLEAFLKQEGIPVLPLVYPFRRYAEEHQAFLHGFADRGTQGEGHWNEDGHQLAGELIGAWLAAGRANGEPRGETKCLP